MLERVKHDVENLSMNVIPLATNPKLLILSEFDMTNDTIEDHQLEIDLAKNDPHSTPFTFEFKEWSKKLSLMQNTIEKIFEIQKVWLQLEPTFKNDSIKKALEADYKKFMEF